MSKISEVCGSLEKEIERIELSIRTEQVIVDDLHKSLEKIKDQEIGVFAEIVIEKRIKQGKEYIKELKDRKYRLEDESNE